MLILQYQILQYSNNMIKSLMRHFIISTITALSTKLYQRFNRGLTLDALRACHVGYKGRSARGERGLEFDVRLEKLYHWQHTSRMVILAMTFIESAYIST